MSATDSLSVYYNLALFKGIAYKLLLTDRRSFFFIIVGIRVFLYSFLSLFLFLWPPLSRLIPHMHILSFDHHYAVDNLHLVIAWCSFNKFEKMRSRKWSVFLAPIGGRSSWICVYVCVRCTRCICISWTKHSRNAKVKCHERHQRISNHLNHTLFISMLRLLSKICINLCLFHTHFDLARFDTIQGVNVCAPFIW